MQIHRLEVTAEELHRWPVMVGDDEHPVVVRVTDADTVTLMAALAPQWEGSFGVWLRADAGYSAGLIARDVKTLSFLCSLDHVVIDADREAAAHAEVVRALLSDGSVTLRNAVATITDAYNRPAPARPLTVWHVEGEGLRHGADRLDVVEARDGVTTYRG